MVKAFQQLNITINKLKNKIALFDGTGYNSGVENFGTGSVEEEEM
ncbi:hypothetical protein [Staphylococcus caeli]